MGMGGGGLPSGSGLQGGSGLPGDLGGASSGLWSMGAEMHGDWLSNSAPASLVCTTSIVSSTLAVTSATHSTSDLLNNTIPPPIGPPHQTGGPPLLQQAPAVLAVDPSVLAGDPSVEASLQGHPALLMTSAGAPVFANGIPGATNLPLPQFMPAQASQAQIGGIPLAGPSGDLSNQPSLWSAKPQQNSTPDLLSSDPKMAWNSWTPPPSM